MGADPWPSMAQTMARLWNIGRTYQIHYFFIILFVVISMWLLSCAYKRGGFFQGNYQTEFSGGISTGNFSRGGDLTLGVFYSKKSLGTASFLCCKSLKPTASLARYWKRIILQTFSFVLITTFKIKISRCSNRGIKIWGTNQWNW